jgi:YedE family putative selenium metabolism protein
MSVYQLTKEPVTRSLWTLKARIILGGLAFGVLAALLTKWGNPSNMGICVACFYRYIAGALGLHGAALVQYLHPEIMGFILGALVSAHAFGEFRPRGGSAPIVRFLLSVFFIIGALVFLGCPVRAVLRLAGGDLNGLTALAGVVAGAAIIAARANRMAGQFAKVTPATRVSQIVHQFPAAFKQYLCQWSGVCYMEGDYGG